MRSNNYKVREKSFEVRPDSSQRREYMDSGDLALISNNGEERVEVKQRPDIDFVDANSFPYSTILVDEVYKVDRDGLLPLKGYMIFDSDGSHV